MQENSATASTSSPGEKRVRLDRASRGQQVCQEIFAAMQRIIAVQGVSHVTLEAVAAEAGISKGGLLYHFASKDALWRGLIRDFHMKFVHSCWDEFAHDAHPNMPGRIHRAWISNASRFEPENILNHSEDMTNILTMISNPQFNGPLHTFVSIWEKMLDRDGVPYDRSMLIRFCLMGLENYGVTHSGVNPELKERLCKRLLQEATIEGHMEYEDTQEAWEESARKVWEEA